MKTSATREIDTRKETNGGIRLTRQRRAILEALRSVDTHPTADEVYDMVRKQLPKVSLGTIYRNLEILCENRLALKLELAGTQRRYDGDVGHHYHIRCVVCGRVADLNMPELAIDQYVKYVPKDFEVIGHRLKFLAVCANCVKAGADLKAVSNNRVKLHH